MAELAPRSELVFPVTILPSGSSSAVAGSPVCTAFSLAASMTGLPEVSMPVCSIKSSIFCASSGNPSPFATLQRASKYRRMISLREASCTASQSTMQLPAMFTPMSVGDL